MNGFRLEFRPFEFEPFGICFDCEGGNGTSERTKKDATLIPGTGDARSTCEKAIAETREASKEMYIAWRNHQNLKE